MRATAMRKQLLLHAEIAGISITTSENDLSGQERPLSFEALSNLMKSEITCPDLGTEVQISTSKHNNEIDISRLRT